jgi:hypothetical protein
MGSPTDPTAKARSYSRRRHFDERSKTMQENVILRRTGWATVGDLATAAARAVAGRDDLPAGIRRTARLEV